VDVTGRVLLVVGVSVVVAIAANGLTLLSPRADPSGGWAWAIRLAGAGVAVVGLMGLLAYRRRLRTGGARGRDPMMGGLRAAGTIMGLLTLVALLNPPASPDRARSSGSGLGLDGLPPFGEGGSSGEAISSRSRGGDSQMRGRRLPDELEGLTVTAGEEDAQASAVARWTMNLLPWVLLLMAIALLNRAARRRLDRARAAPMADAVLAEDDAEAGLEASLADVVEYSSDPRGQITKAYHRLLSALAAAGAPREPQEAPHEHLHRALGPLGVHAAPLHRLTGLYVLAQFSERPLRDEHRAAAVDALEGSLAGLREARPR